LSAHVKFASSRSIITRLRADLRVSPLLSGEHWRIQICGARCLYNFWGPLEEKEYKITNTKLGTKVNIYL